MAAHLALNGIESRLWNRSKANLEAIQESGHILASGIVNGEAVPSLVSHDLGKSIDGVEVIMITTPATAHQELAQQLAPHLKKNHIIILNPGRTLGAWSFAKELRNAGLKSLPRIAEAQTIVYTCRTTGRNSVEILALKENVPISAIPMDQTSSIIESLPNCIGRRFSASDSMIETSLGNIGMILHCLPMLMNVGWIEAEQIPFRYYYQGITPTIARLLEQLDQERLEIASTLGCKLPSITDWFHTAYRIKADDLYSAIRRNKAYETIDAPASLDHRYLMEDVPFGLVPMEKIAMELKIPTPLTSMTISLAEKALNKDLRGLGRQADGFKEF